MKQRSTASLCPDADGSATVVSAINPFEASDVTVEIRDYDSNDSPAVFQFALQCSRDALSEQLFDFGVVRFRVLVPTEASATASPTITIRAERGASIENATDVALDLRIHYPATLQQTSIAIAAGHSQQIGMSLKDDAVVVEVGVRTKALEADAASDVLQWSSQVRLSTQGDLKPCIVPFKRVRGDAAALAGSYLIELTRDAKHVVRLTIRPQVVVLNTTVRCWHEWIVAGVSSLTLLRLCACCCYSGHDAEALTNQQRRRQSRGGSNASGASSHGLCIKTGCHAYNANKRNSVMDAGVSGPCKRRSSVVHTRVSLGCQEAEHHVERCVVAELDVLAPTERRRRRLESPAASEALVRVPRRTRRH